MLVNGLATHLISIRDRGVLYGDGIFRTLLVEHGVACHWVLHYQKLQQDCAALRIFCPNFELLSAELRVLLAQHPNGIFKIVVTRGIALRGYAPQVDAEATHFWDVAPLPVYPEHYLTEGIAACFCQLRLGHQPRLAGIKHLNRLENVLAAAEIQDATEGIMLDEQDRVIEGTRSNLFLVQHGRLITPDLSRCGVSGLQRQRITEQMDVQIQDVSVAQLLEADEVFLTNSVIGVWSLSSLASRRWTDFPIAQRVRRALRG